MKWMKYNDVFSQVGSPAEAAQYGYVGSPTEATFSILLNDKKDTDKVVERNGKEKGSIS